jgi:hypothetical protein
MKRRDFVSFLAVRRLRSSSPRWIARQRLPYIRLRNSELSSNSRWRDARLESSANGIHFSLRQRNGDRFNAPLAWAFIRHRELPAATPQLSDNCRNQSVELLIKMLDRTRQVSG